MPSHSQESKPIRNVIILHHPKVAAARQLAADMAAFFQAQQVTVKTASIDDAAAQRLANFDMALALGGDGTMLRAGGLCAPGGVPLLGVNLGRLGFLAEVQPAEWRSALERLLAGEFWLENRMMLRVDHRRGSEPLGTWWVLNECTVSRGATPRPVRLITEIDGERLTTYVADGLIVATATGSTAYALAAGGPIMPPEMRNMLIIPVAPHMSLERAIILAEGAEIDIVIKSDHEAIMSADEQVQVPLRDGDRIGVRASGFTAQFARLQEPMYFYRTLMARIAAAMTDGG